MLQLGRVVVVEEWLGVTLARSLLLGALGGLLLQLVLERLRLRWKKTPGVVAGMAMVQEGGRWRWMQKWGLAAAERRQEEEAEEAGWRHPLLVSCWGARGAWEGRYRKAVAGVGLALPLERGARAAA